MTIEQTVEIPADRRIFFDLPPELPVGKAKVELTFTLLSVAPDKEGREKIRLTKPMIDNLLQGDALRSLTGLLHTEMTIDEIRTERSMKHDYTDTNVVLDILLNRQPWYTNAALIFGLAQQKLIKSYISASTRTIHTNRYHH